LHFDRDKNNKKPPKGKTGPKDKCSQANYMSRKDINNKIFARTNYDEEEFSDIRIRRHLIPDVRIGRYPFGHPQGPTITANQFHEMAERS